MDQLDEQFVVFRDDLWAAEIMPGAEVPGWIVLRARRHAERITSLDDAESDAFGRHVRDLSAALAAVTDTPTTYLMAFCENHPHFHALITPCGANVPPERRGGNILNLREHQTDPVAAVRVISAVRQTYQLTQLTPLPSSRPWSRHRRDTA